MMKERKHTGIFVRLWIGAIVITLLLGVTTLVDREAGQVTAAESAGQSIYVPLLANYEGHPYSSRFGVQKYGNTSPTTPYYQPLLDSRSTWLRTDIEWDEVEPVNTTPDNYNWAAADVSLAAAQTRYGNFKLVVVLASNPDWAATHSQGVIDKVSLSEYTEFVGAVVERYDGDGIDDAPGRPVVNYFEFFNEPDGAGDVFVAAWGDDGDKYAALLKAVYPVVKAANPNAQVVFGGVAHDAFQEDGGNFVRSFIDDVLQAGAGPYFDYMNFHAYPAFSFNWTTQGPGLFEKTQALRAKLAQYGLNKPFMVTEAGWHSNNAPNAFGSPEVQSRYVVQLLTQSMAADIKVMIWWMLFDPGSGYPYDNGLVTNINAGPIQYKPAMSAFQITVAKLGETTYDRQLTAAELGANDVFAYQFDDAAAGLKRTVAWVNPIDTGIKRNIRIPGSQATLYNIYGQQTAFLRDGDDGLVDGRVTLLVSAQPTYIEVPK